MKRYIPILDWLPRYRWEDLRGDSVAAVTVAVMLIPQSMAVALLAGLPPIVGLYTAMGSVLLYPIFGTSRHLVITPVALISLLVASGVGDLAEPFTSQYVVYATLLAALVGIIQVAMGVVRFGFLVNFLSLPVISGFTWAAAVIIGLSQVENVLGIPHGAPRHAFTELPHILGSIGETNGPTAAIGLSSLVALLILKRWKATFPRGLAVVIVTTSMPAKSSPPTASRTSVRAFSGGIR
jgi:SulP family sulfate permease